MSTLIFICGHAGTGKTTLAKRLVRDCNAESADSYCLLDKDTLYGNYSSAVMGVLTGDPNDRDSPPYLQHLRDPEYAGLLDTARENLALDTNVVVVGPLSREVRAHRLQDPQWLRVPPGTTVHVVWVHLQEEEARRRIEQRGNPNDRWKLAHWDAYRSRLFRLDPDSYPEVRLYDNTAPREDDYLQLKAALRTA